MSNLIVKAAENAPPGWTDFVDAHPESKIYHLPEWNAVVQRTFGHRIHYLTMYDGTDICGVLPLTEFNSRIFGRFAVSQPFINYGGPLLKNGADMSELQHFLNRFREENRYKHIELRMENALESDLPVKQHKVTFFMDLPSDPDELMSSFKAKIRSQIRRPEKENMTPKAGGKDLLDDYYHVYTVNMRDLGTPPLPRTFFANILDIFPDNAFIVTVNSEEGIPVAGSFLIKYRDTVEIPWASSLREYNRYSPNMMLYWESFRLSIEKGAKCFDFGRCTPGVGTYRFKKQWKGREHPLSWYYVLPEGEALPEINPENAKFSLAIKTWTKLPLGVTRFVGPKIIKHIP